MNGHVTNESAAALATGFGLLHTGGADVGAMRERLRRRRVAILGLIVAVPVLGLLIAHDLGHGVALHMPHLDPVLVAPIAFFVLLAVVLVASTVGPGRSPHLTFRPEQIDVKLADVRGIDQIKEDVVRSLNLFLAHRTFAKEMGGTPRRGLLFEGAPGTGKTYLAKAMAAEAGVPFLFVSATSFQSMFYGATAKKIRSYFKALRKTARREGGAIGFIEEIDAIGMVRGGMSGMSAVRDGVAASVDCGGLAGLSVARIASGAGFGTVRNAFTSEGTGGVVNELLVQMQSFDDPTGWNKVVAKVTDVVNLLLPPNHQLTRKAPPAANVLLIAATNRADGLDPALLRPGRFDRRLTFEMPAKAARRDLIDYMIGKKSHDTDLDREERRDALAAVTQGYTPVMIEHLMDEALVSALRRGTTEMSWADLEHARLVEEVGMGQPVAYTEHERRLIATHESGHATIAWLVAPHRRLEILSIIKRRDALGMLAHGDAEDVYTRSRSELLALMQISFGGQVAEELFFGDVSTGPAGDLAYATGVAAEMVGSSGMTGSLVSYRAVSSGAFNDTNIVGRVLGDAEGRASVEKLLGEQKATVVSLLSQHRHLVEALRDALIERSELIGEQITDVLEAAQRAVAPAVIDLRAEDDAVVNVRPAEIDPAAGH
jgi:cell division protease FtsH